MLQDEVEASLLKQAPAAWMLPETPEILVLGV